MNELEKWYQANRMSVEKKGVTLSLPLEQSHHYIDGNYDRYMFRFIDRGHQAPDIEIVNIDSAKTVKHGLDLSNADISSIYDSAIDFIVGLS
jgi:hypothetical protein